jgi:hypothetical protein
VNVNFKSKQFIFSILAGIIVGLLASIFLKPMCWGAIAGVFVAAYLAKVSSPKDGAVVGAIVLMPISIYTFSLGIVQSSMTEKMGITGIFLVFILGVVSESGIGALLGLIIGKLFQTIKDKGLFF